MKNCGFGWKAHAGLIWFCFVAFRWEWNVHIFVKRSHWIWGHEEDWYDGPLPQWGLGPLFLVAAMWSRE